MPKSAASAQMVESRAAYKSQTGRPRGRPRSGAADRAILDATREILEESGSAGFSIGEVVARTGVSTATIYRRWASASELILEVVRSLVPNPVVVDSGSLQGDLDLFLRHIGEVLLSVKGIYAADLKRGGINEPELRQEITDYVVLPREQILASILQRAHQRGELDRMPPLDVCWDFVVGPVHHRLLIRGASYTARAHRESTRVSLAALRSLGES